jgi:redox-sensitive bicupin YhaK (pirin superfamily)
MITIRKSEDRGHADNGWLKSHHTFTFGSYKDAAHSGFRALRVINDDTVAAGRGFGAHAHRDMEILSYVLEGKLAHKDSMGHVEVLGPNEIQKMSAGDGVIHSEFNGSETEPVHFLQIWIESDLKGTAPAYEQIAFRPEEKLNRLKTLASSASVQGAVQIQQDATMAVAELTPNSSVTHALATARAAWLHVVFGEVTVNGQPLKDGDSAAIENEANLEIVGTGTHNSEVLLFDLG